ncbi:unnamed protein product [marine sediment metagenome]|uniref:Uncharacterized protein n=1 Tax=marine sediment metagenome TaxID=412755 RepID=X1G889_9ZZZZ
MSDSLISFWYSLCTIKELTTVLITNAIKILTHVTKNIVNII